MKKIITSIFLAVVTLSSSIGHAAPERIAIKSADKAEKEKIARSQIKNMSLGDIEDPAARAAIQQIYNYLGIEVKK